MFKLILMYAMMHHNGYVTNHVEIIGGFPNKAECEVYGKAMADGISSVKGYIKGYGSAQCEVDKK